MSEYQGNHGTMVVTRSQAARAPRRTEIPDSDSENSVVRWWFREIPDTDEEDEAWSTASGGRHPLASFGPVPGSTLDVRLTNSLDPDAPHGVQGPHQETVSPATQDPQTQDPQHESEVRDTDGGNSASSADDDCLSTIYVAAGSDSEDEIKSESDSGSILPDIAAGPSSAAGSSTAAALLTAADPLFAAGSIGVDSLPTPASTRLPAKANIKRGLMYWLDTLPESKRQRVGARDETFFNAAGDNIYDSDDAIHNIQSRDQGGDRDSHDSRITSRRNQCLAPLTLGMALATNWTMIP